MSLNYRVEIGDVMEWCPTLEGIDGLLVAQIATRLMGLMPASDMKTLKRDKKICINRAIHIVDSFRATIVNHLDDKVWVKRLINERKRI